MYTFNIYPNWCVALYDAKLGGNHTVQGARQG